MHYYFDEKGIKETDETNLGVKCCSTEDCRG